MKLTSDDIATLSAARDIAAFLAVHDSDATVAVSLRECLDFYIDKAGQETDIETFKPDFLVWDDHAKVLFGTASTREFACNEAKRAVCDNPGKSWTVYKATYRYINSGVRCLKAAP